MDSNEPPRGAVVEYLDDRRHRQDRRSARDRRDSGQRQAPSPIPRPYGFRAFDDRRSGAERRSEAQPPYAIAAGVYTAGLDDGPLIELTADEIAVLLDRDAP